MIEGVAWRSQMFDVGEQLSNVVQTLDMARTRLVREGIEYLDEAWAFVDGGRVVVASYGIQVAMAVLP